MGLELETKVAQYNIVFPTSQARKQANLERRMQECLNVKRYTINLKRDCFVLLKTVIYVVLISTMHSFTPQLLVPIVLH